MVISLKTHNIMDYVIGAVLLMSPWIFQFDAIEAARTLFIVMGFTLISYSLLTNYEYSLYKVIPLRWHMILDLVAGFFILIGPALFQYQDNLTSGQRALHFVMGIGAIGLVLVTKPKVLGQQRKQPA